MGIDSILDFLTGSDGGAFLVVGWALAWALEGSPWWQALTGKAKSLIILAVSLALGGLTVYLKMHPAIVEAIAPYVEPLIYVVLAWLGTQVPHKINPSRILGRGKA